MNASPLSVAQHSHDEVVDVVVVGAGPVGATLGLLLSRVGWRVEVWDENTAPSTGPGASAVESVHRATLEPAGIWDRMQTREVETISVTLRHGLAPMFLQPPSPFVKFDQEQFRAASWEALRGDRSLTFRPGVRFVGASNCSDGSVNVGGVSTTSPKSSHHIAAKWVVGCDGPASRVREHIGGDPATIAPSQPWLFAEGFSARDDCATNHIVADPTRPGTWFAIPGGRVRIEALLHNDERDQETVAELASQLVRDWVGGDVRLDRVQRIGMHARVANRWQRGHLLIAGDAAHQLPFYLGRGLGLGLSDAAALAWRLSAALHGDDEPLRAYQDDRASEAHEQLKNTLSLGALAYTFDEEAAAQRDAFLQANDVKDILALAASSHTDLAALENLIATRSVAELPSAGDAKLSVDVLNV